MRIMVVVGTRPEAIKLAPVILQLGREKQLELTIVATAQHREMLDQVFGEFGIEPDLDLNLMAQGQSLAEFTSRCIAALDPVLKEKAPDLVIGQGDTTTAFVAALLSFYNRIDFAHVEAGLRTHDMANPFPEEFNRTAIGKLATLHFAPTDNARDNLLAEGVLAEAVIVTGNTVIDALHRVASNRALRGPRQGSAWRVLVTLHRRENFGAPVIRICEALEQLLEKYRSLSITWPVHPNPNVRERVHATFDGHPRVRLSPPLGYGDFVRAISDADIILTDSGGVQEEAPALGKPVLVMREETERPEAISAGVALLAGTGTAGIVDAVSRLIDDPTAYQAMAKGASPYGDGHASERIWSVIQDHYALVDHDRKGTEVIFDDVLFPKNTTSRASSRT